MASNSESPVDFDHVDQTLTVITKGFVRGLLSAMNLPRAFQPLVKSREALTSVAKCMAANAVLIVGSESFALQRGLLPLVRVMGKHFYGDSPSPLWVELHAALLYRGLWLGPIWFLIYLAVNSPTYAECSCLSFDLNSRDRGATGPSSTATTPRGIGGVSEELYGRLIISILVAQRCVQTPKDSSQSLLDHSRL